MAREDSVKCLRCLLYALNLLFWVSAATRSGPGRAGPGLPPPPPEQVAGSGAGTAGWAGGAPRAGRRGGDCPPWGRARARQFLYGNAERCAGRGAEE